MKDCIEAPFRNPDKFAYDVTTRIRISKGLVVYQINGGELSNNDSIGIVPSNSENLFRSSSDELIKKRVEAKVSEQTTNERSEGER